MSSNKQSDSRIDVALDSWSVQEDKYVAKYGKGVYQDRDFMKVRKDALQKIYNDYKSKPLNLEEKMDLRILKGQLKQINKTLYPNRSVRVARSVLSFLSRPLQAALKAAADFLSLSFTGRPAFKQKPSRSQPMRAPQMRIVPPLNAGRNKNSQGKNNANKKEPVKLTRSSRPRIVSENSTSKGLRR